MPDTSGPTMKAVTYAEYGPPTVLQVQSVKKPVPGPKDVLVRIHAATVSVGDLRMRKADPWVVRLVNGLRRPSRVRILGAEFSGKVESVGSAVTKFSPGDAVFGAAGFKLGAHAEYICLREDADLALKPVNMTYEEAAAVQFGGGSALHFLKRARIRPGQKVLIYGASGSVGVFAVQLAKYFGAHVTAVCSTANLDLVKALGADAVVDYTREDFTATGQIYDVVFDAVGKTSLSHILRCLRRGGVYVQLGGPGGLSAMLGLLLRGAWTSLTGAARVVSGVARATPENTALLKSLIESGKLRTVIDRRYPLEDIAEAHAYADTGRKKGHVVILLHPRAGEVDRVGS